MTPGGAQLMAKTMQVLPGKRVLLAGSGPFLLVVAFGQHGVERGDRAGARGAVAGTLDKLRQAGEHRGRIAARGRRLAHRQADLALRLGEAGQ